MPDNNNNNKRHYPPEFPLSGLENLPVYNINDPDRPIPEIKGAAAPFPVAHTNIPIPEMPTVDASKYISGSSIFDNDQRNNALANQTRNNVNQWGENGVNNFIQRLTDSGVEFEQLKNAGPDNVAAFKIRQNTQYGKPSNSLIQLDTYGNVFVSGEGKEHGMTAIPNEYRGNLDGLIDQVKAGRISQQDAISSFNRNITSNVDVFFEHINSGKSLSESIYKDTLDIDDDTRQGLWYQRNTMTDQNRSRASQRVLLRNDRGNGIYEKLGFNVVHKLLEVTGLSSQYSSDSGGSSLDRIDARQRVNYAQFDVERNDGTIETFNIQEKSKRTKQQGEADQYEAGRTMGLESMFDRVQRGWRTPGERTSASGYKQRIGISARNTLVQEGAALGRNNRVLWRNEEHIITQEQMNKLNLNTTDVYRNGDAGAITLGDGQRWSNMSAKDLAEAINISNPVSYQAIAIDNIQKRDDGRYTLSLRKAIENESSAKRDGIKYNVTTVSDDLMNSVTRTSDGSELGLDLLGSASNEAGLVTIAMNALGIGYTTDELNNLMIAHDIGINRLEDLATGNTPESERAMEIYNYIEENAPWMFDTKDYQQPAFLQDETQYKPGQYVPSTSIEQAEERLNFAGGELQGHSSVVLASLAAEFAQTQTETVTMANRLHSFDEMAIMIQASHGGEFTDENGKLKSVADISKELREMSIDEIQSLLTMQTEVLEGGRFTGQSINTFDNLNFQQDKQGNIIGINADVSENITMLDIMTNDKPEHFRGKMNISQEMLDNMATQNPEAYATLTELDNADYFNNWALDLVRAYKSNDPTPEGRMARDRIKTTTVADIGSSKIATYLEEARNELGEDASEFQIYKSFLRKLTNDYGGDTALSIGNSILPSSRAALANLTQNKEGKSVENFAKTYVESLLLEADLNDAKKLGQTERIAELESQRDIAVYNTLNNMGDSIGQSVLTAAGSIKMNAVGGAANVTSALEANEVAITKRQLHEMTGARTKEEKKMVEDLARKGELPLLGTMYPHPNASEAFHNMQIRFVDEINEAAGREILDPTARNVYISQAFAFSHAKDFDADDFIGGILGGFVGEGEDRRWVGTNATVDSAEKIMRVAELDPGGEFSKQFSEKFLSTKKRFENVSKKIYGEFDSDGKLKKKGIYLSNQEAAEQHMDALYSKGQMSVMYNMGIRGMYNMSRLMSQNDTSVVGRIARAAQLPYQAAIDSEASKDHYLNRYREMFNNFNLDSRSNPKKQNALLWHPDKDGNAQFEWFFNNRDVARQILKTSTGIMMDTDPDDYAKNIAPNIAAANIPLSILQDDERRDAAIKGGTKYLIDRQKNYKETDEDTFTTQGWLNAIGITENDDIDELNLVFGAGGVDTAAVAPGMIAGRAAMKHADKNPDMTDEQFENKFGKDINVLRHMAEVADMGRMSNKESSIDKWVGATLGHVKDIGQRSVSLARKIFGMEQPISRQEVKELSKGSIKDRINSQAPASITPQPKSGIYYNDPHSGQIVYPERMATPENYGETVGVNETELNPNYGHGKTASDINLSLAANSSDLNAISQDLENGEMSMGTKINAILSKSMPGKHRDQVKNIIHERDANANNGRSSLPPWWSKNYDSNKAEKGTAIHESLQNNILNNTPSEIFAATNANDIYAQGFIDTIMPTSDDTGVIVDIKTIDEGKMKDVAPNVVGKYGAQLGSYLNSDVAGGRLVKTVDKNGNVSYRKRQKDEAIADGNSALEVSGNMGGVMLLERTEALESSLSILNDENSTAEEKAQAQNDYFAESSRQSQLLLDSLQEDRRLESELLMLSIATQTQKRFDPDGKRDVTDFYQPVVAVNKSEATPLAQKASQAFQAVTKLIPGYDKFFGGNKKDNLDDLSNDDANALADWAVDRAQGKPTPIPLTESGKQEQQAVREKARAQQEVYNGRPVPEEAVANHQQAQNPSMESIEQTPAPSVEKKPSKEESGYFNYNLLNISDGDSRSFASTPLSEKPTPPTLTPASAGGGPPNNNNNDVAVAGANPERPEGGNGNNRPSGVPSSPQSAGGISRNELKEIITDLIVGLNPGGSDSGRSVGSGGFYNKSLTPVTDKDIGTVNKLIDIFETVENGIATWEQFGKTVSQVTETLETSTEAQQKTVSRIVDAHNEIKKIEGRILEKNEAGKPLTQKEKDFLEKVRNSKAMQGLNTPDENNRDGGSIIEKFAEIAGASKADAMMTDKTKPAMGMDERQARLEAVLLAGGVTGKVRRENALKQGLYGKSEEEGDRGGIDLGFMNVTDPNKLNALGGAARFFNRAQGMLWAGSHIKHMIIDPLMGQADAYQQIEASRAQTRLVSGANSFDDFLNSSAGDIRRRQIAGEQFQRGFGRSIYNTISPVLEAGNKGLGGTLGLAASTVAPALGGASLVSALGFSSLSMPLIAGGLAAVGAGANIWSNSRDPNVISEFTKSMMQDGSLGNRITNLSGLLSTQFASVFDNENYQDATKLGMLEGGLYKSYNLNQDINWAKGNSNVSFKMPSQEELNNIGAGGGLYGFYNLHQDINWAKGNSNVSFKMPSQEELNNIGAGEFDLGNVLGTGVALMFGGIPGALAYNGFFNEKSEEEANIANFSPKELKEMLQEKYDVSDGEWEVATQNNFITKMQEENFMSESEANNLYAFLRRYSPNDVYFGGALSKELSQLSVEGLVKIPESIYQVSASQGIDSWEDDKVLGVTDEITNFFNPLSPTERLRQQEKLNETSSRNATVNQYRAMANREVRDKFYYTSAGEQGDLNTFERDALDASDINISNAFLSSEDFATETSALQKLTQGRYLENDDTLGMYSDQARYLSLGEIYNKFRAYDANFNSAGTAFSLMKWKNIDDSGQRDRIYAALIQNDPFARAIMSQRGELDNTLSNNMINTNTGLSIFATAWGSGDQSGYINDLRGYDTQGYFDGVDNDTLMLGTQTIQQMITRKNRDIQVQQRDYGIDMSAGQYAMTTGGRGREYLSSLTDLGDALDPVTKGFKELGEIFEKYGSKYQQGLGMSLWDLEDAQKDLGREQRLFQKSQTDQSFSLQERGLDLRIRQFYEQMGLQRRQMDYGYNRRQNEMTIGRGIQQKQEEWKQEDWAFGRAQSEIQFGWQMEDFDRNMRYARGRERRDIMRQQERATIQYAMTASKSDRDKERLKEQEKWSAEKYDRDKQHFEMTRKFEEESYQMKIRYFEEDIAMQKEQIDMSRQRIEKENEWRQEQWELEDERIRMQRQMYVFQTSTQETLTLKAKETNDEVFGLTQTLTGFAEISAQINAEHEAHTRSGEEFNSYMSNVSGGIDMVALSVEAFKNQAINAAQEIQSAWSNSPQSKIFGVFETMNTQLNTIFSKSVSTKKNWLDSYVSLRNYMTGGSVEIEGYKGGGYTGMGGIGVDAGTVHAGEYVIPSGGVPIVRGDNPEQVRWLKRIAQLLEEIKSQGPGRVNATIYTKQDTIQTNDIVNDIYRVM